MLRTDEVSCPLTSIWDYCWDGTSGLLVLGHRELRHLGPDRTSSSQQPPTIDDPLYRSDAARSTKPPPSVTANRHSQSDNSVIPAFVAVATVNESTKRSCRREE